MADGRVTIDIILDEKGAVKGIAGLEDSLNGVEKNDGSKVAVYAGEVSVRGIYGYV